MIFGACLVALAAAWYFLKEKPASQPGTGQPGSTSQPGAPPK